VFSGIGLETSILFAKEGANVLMTDLQPAALETAVKKVLQLVPNAGRVEGKVRTTPGQSTLFGLRIPIPLPLVGEQ